MALHVGVLRSQALCEDGEVLRCADGEGGGEDGGCCYSLRGSDTLLFQLELQGLEVG